MLMSLFSLAYGSAVGGKECMDGCMCVGEVGLQLQVEDSPYVEMRKLDQISPSFDLE